VSARGALCFGGLIMVRSADAYFARLRRDRAFRREMTRRQRELSFQRNKVDLVRIAPDEVDQGNSRSQRSAA